MSIQTSRNASSVAFIQQQFPKTKSSIHSVCAHATNQSALQQALQNDATTKVNQVAKPYLFTPLITLIMAEKFDLAIWFVENYKPNPNVQDRKGWTAVHHAAAKNHRILVLAILRLYPNHQLKNSDHGTYADILSLSNPQSPSGSVHFHTKDSVATMTHSEVAKTLNATSFRNDCYLDSENMYALWSQASDCTSSSTPFLDKEYRAFKATPPPVYLKETKNAGISVYSGANFHPGQILLEYCGELRLTPQNAKMDIAQSNMAFAQKIMGIANKELPTDRTDDYQFANIFPHNHLSTGAMLADGFPLCKVIDIPNLAGLPVRRLVFAMVPIPKNTLLTFDYGIKHSVKVLVHQELHLDHLMSFFQRNPFKNFLLDVSRFQDETVNLFDPRSLENTHQVDVFYYLLNTPAAIFLLVGKQIIEIEEIQQVFLDPKLTSLFFGMEVHHPHFAILKTFVHILYAFTTTKMDKGNIERLASTYTTLELMQHMCDKAGMQMPEFKFTLES